MPLPSTKDSGTRTSPNGASCRSWEGGSGPPGASTSLASSRLRWDDFEVVNRPATGVTTRRPEEPDVNSTCPVL